MKYLHQDNRHLQFVDWRLPENRMEGFLRWLKWRLDWSDLDHYAVNNAYRDHANMTQEQQFWYATIFGMTYQSEMAWVIFNSFPDFAKIDIKDVEKWNDDNYTRQMYARDTKYNKGRIAEQVKSIQEVVKPFGTLTNFYESLLKATEHASYESVFNGVQLFQKYGRMTAWITAQVLFETAGLPAKPDTVLATDPSSWSVRSGLMYLYAKDNKIEAKDKSVRFTEEEMTEVAALEKDLWAKCEAYLCGAHSEIFSNYLVESHLCQYKKLMLGGDYAGHSSGDHFSRAQRLGELWPEVDFAPFYSMMGVKYHPLVRSKPENKILRDLTCQTGQMINMHDDFPDMPNMYKELGITSANINDETPQGKAFLKNVIDRYAANHINGNGSTSLEGFFS